MEKRRFYSFQSVDGKLRRKTYRTLDTNITRVRTDTASIGRTDESATRFGRPEAATAASGKYYSIKTFRARSPRQQLAAQWTTVTLLMIYYTCIHVMYIIIRYIYERRRPRTISSPALELFAVVVDPMAYVSQKGMYAEWFLSMLIPFPTIPDAQISRCIFTYDSK